MDILFTPIGYVRNDHPPGHKPPVAKGAGRSTVNVSYSLPIRRPRVQAAISSQFRLFRYAVGRGVGRFFYGEMASREKALMPMSV